ncbi:MAG: hypothetical protein V3U79_04890 [Dehalococcoidia bacterium]
MDKTNEKSGSHQVVKTNEKSGSNLVIQHLGSGVVLLTVVGLGIAALLYFFNQLLKPGDFASISLPVVALVAAVAATFNPCGLPALPGFLAFAGSSGGAVAGRRRASMSLMTGLGAVSVVIGVGVIVALAGGGTKGVIAPYFRWVQVTVGLILIAMAGLHLAGQSARLPLVAGITGVGSRIWGQAMGAPSHRKSYLFGAGFVAVGVG